MRIDKGVITSRRNQKGWTQEHFAQVAGLSTRTVQRVESTGAVSAETAQAMCAVLELKIEQITLPSTSKRSTLSYPMVFVCLVAILGFGFGLVVGIAL